MKIVTVDVKTQLKEAELVGLSKAYFTVLMKSNKTNSMAPINHFQRERLVRRRDRAALNHVLNAMVNSLSKKAKDKAKSRRKTKPLMLEGVAFNANAEPVQAMDVLRHTGVIIRCKSRHIKDFFPESRHVAVQDRVRSAKEKIRPLLSLNLVDRKHVDAISREELTDALDFFEKHV